MFGAPTIMASLGLGGYDFKKCVETLQDVLLADNNITYFTILLFLLIPPLILRLILLDP